MLGYRPVDPALVRNHMAELSQCYEDLKNLAAERRARLEDSRRLWQFFWDVAELEQGFKVLEKTLSSEDVGHDVTSVHLLMSNHKVSVIDHQII